MAIKYQAKIHKAYADEIDKPARESFEELKAQHPEVPMSFTGSTPANALRESNVAYCKHYYIDTEHLGDNLILLQSAKASLEAYDCVCRALTCNAQETVYTPVLKSIKANLEAYCALAVEDALAEEYGKDYTDFVARYTAEEEAKQAKRVATRKANEAKREAEESEA